jgi:hypothetical protein
VSDHADLREEIKSREETSGVLACKKTKTFDNK